MIARATGEILFQDGLSFSPQELLTARHLLGSYERMPLSVPGWIQHFLGVHESEHGRFSVEAVTDPALHIQTVFLSHAHPFYRPKAENDGERRAYHEGVIAKDLAGQREFSWGQVFCRVQPEEIRDWIVVAYTLGPHVPLDAPDILLRLSAHAGELRDG